MPVLRVAACQLNLTVGDLDGNVEAMLTALERAEAESCDLAVFPELAITGYPPEDLLLKPGFVADNQKALEALAARTGGCAAIVGFVDAERDLFNAAAVCAEGAVVGVERKRLLPNYAVFDEQRYFAPGGGDHRLYVVGGARIGISICEDAWSPGGPIATQAAGGAELIVNLSASPFHVGRQAERERMLATRAADASCPLVYVNLVGGQDELVFDGGSLVFDAAGRVAARAAQFREHLMIVDVDLDPVFRKRMLDPRGRASAPRLEEVVISASPVPDRARSSGNPALIDVLAPVPEVYAALVLGTRDYARKNGFADVVIGLSGGVDSSLVAAVATDALGPDHVHGVAMPSRYSSEGSVTDARALATNLEIDFRVIPIEVAHVAFETMLAPVIPGFADSLAAENVQARIRGTTLMALSNAFGWLVLTTGNKSEMAVGFTTLYGDLAGGYAVIKDVTKRSVYELCRDRNRRAQEAGAVAPIPESVLTKAPSAELRPDQRDDQSLPPYEQLDPVLEAYVEGDATVATLEQAGFEAELVRRIVGLVDRAEYKRRQAPPGIRVTAKAFGKDRRLPVTNHYRG